MKKTVLKYGLRAGILLVALSWASFYLTRSSGVAVAQIASIVVILGALVFVPMAMRSLRQSNGNIISFWMAFFTGAFTSIVPALFMFVSTIVFMVVQRAEYAEWSESNISSEMSGDVGAVVMNPFEQGVIMFLIVMVLGTITSLISAMVIQRARPH
jgi:hypothetical protein